MTFQSDTTLVNGPASRHPSWKKFGAPDEQTEKDSTACKMMCGAMMDHKKLTKAMLETLYKKGVVDECCMSKMTKQRTGEPEKIRHH